MPLNKLFEQYWLPLTFFIMFLIAVGSLYPAVQLPPVPGSDKTHHFIGYGLLAFPAAYAKPKRFWLVMGCLMIFGGVIEIIQPYVNRYGELLDFAANCAGLFVGIITATVIRALVSRKL